MTQRIFILSPASCHGRRARLLFNEPASFDLAVNVRRARGVPLGEVFAFLSSLYFRGKLAYAQAYGRAPRRLPAVQVITPSRGLVNASLRVTLKDLREFAGVPIDLDEPRYRSPLEQSAKTLAAQIARDACEVVLLGSIATDKYVSILAGAFGSRLRLPAEFAGRGDMSRGGLLLRCVDDGNELTYVPLEVAARHGARPPRLERRPARRIAR